MTKLVNNIHIVPQASIPLLNSDETREWLRRSGPPGEDELPRITDSIQFHEAQLHHLQIEIDARVEPAPESVTLGQAFGLPLPRWRTKRRKGGLLDDLRKIQEGTVAEIESLRSLLAPIRRLPPDLLAEIFMYCLPRQKFIRPAPDQAPLLLAQICTSWRRASISTPRLWASLELDGFHTKTTIPKYKRRIRNLIRPWFSPTVDRPANTKVSKDKQRISNLIYTWFSRTGDCPLSLSILDDSLLLPSVSKSLDDFAGRWQHLSLLVPEHTHRCLDPSYEYSSLESFKLHTVEGLDEVLVHDLSRSILHAPQLARFIWENDIQQSTPIEMIWENLTYLILSTPMTTQQCLTILPRLSRIQYLNFHDILTGPEDLPRCSVSLPHLKSLVLCSTEDIYPVLNALTLPNLREFVLDIRSWPHNSIVNLFHRSRCPLERLFIYLSPLSDTQLLECLECVHTTLIEFTLQADAEYGLGLPITDAVLEKLTNTGVGEVLCPKLQIIAMYECIRCTEGRFADMVRSRLLPPLPPTSPIAEEALRPCVETLKLVEMDEGDAMALELQLLPLLGLVLQLYPMDGSTPKKEDVERLRELQEQGLVLTEYSPDTGHYGHLEEDY
ncbi:hypothetical protein M413DRAFT_446804 [Hebeloma cylindrosporum]|uniref:Uncharacterized protein n=1 Tax=Hebeloma cylindrosporum TaxID=76867 RepID=A0A0C2XQH8_HEBCY|nr:hypothetical protein M413DRAFT_446804 [Hebeloma cylindrosporum h7]